MPLPASPQSLLARAPWGGASPTAPRTRLAQTSSLPSECRNPRAPQCKLDEQETVLTAVVVGLLLWFMFLWGFCMWRAISRLHSLSYSEYRVANQVARQQVGPSCWEWCSFGPCARSLHGMH